MFVNVLAYSRAAWTIFEVLSKVVRAARGTWARETTASLTIPAPGRWKHTSLYLPSLPPHPADWSPLIASPVLGLIRDGWEDATERRHCALTTLS